MGRPVPALATAGGTFGTPGASVVGKVRFAYSQNPTSGRTMIAVRKISQPERLLILNRRDQDVHQLMALRALKATINYHEYGGLSVAQGGGYGKLLQKPSARHSWPRCAASAWSRATEKVTEEFTVSIE